jgi:hypothetical protein
MCVYACVQSSKLVSEKQDHIDVLQERVATLEQRLHGQSLSGDDRVTALQNEVCFWKALCDDTNHEYIPEIPLSSSALQEVPTL